MTHAPPGIESLFHAPGNQNGACALDRIRHSSGEHSDSQIEEIAAASNGHDGGGHLQRVRQTEWLNALI